MSARVGANCSLAQSNKIMIYELINRNEAKEARCQIRGANLEPWFLPMKFTKIETGLSKEVGLASSIEMDFLVS